MKKIKSNTLDTYDKFPTCSPVGAKSGFREETVDQPIGRRSLGISRAAL